jgi:hypothetical protein
MATTGGKQAGQGLLEPGISKALALGQGGGIGSDSRLSLPSSSREAEEPSGRQPGFLPGSVGS